MAGEEAEEGHFIFSPFPQWLGIQGCDLDQSPSFKRQQGRGESLPLFSQCALTPKTKLQEKRKKYLGIFKLSGPLDLNVCLQVNDISKLSIKKHLEEFGPSEGFQA